MRAIKVYCSIGCSFFTSFKRKGPAPHGVEPFSKLFNYFKILRGSGLFIQHELSINRFFVAPASDDFPDFREIIYALASTVLAFFKPHVYNINLHD